MMWPFTRHPAQPAQDRTLQDFYVLLKDGGFAATPPPFTVEPECLGYYLGNSYRLKVAGITVAKIHSYAGCEFMEFTEDARGFEDRLLAQMRAALADQRKQDDTRAASVAETLDRALEARAARASD